MASILRYFTSARFEQQTPQESADLKVVKKLANRLNPSNYFGKVWIRIRSCVTPRVKVASDLFGRVKKLDTNSPAYQAGIDALATFYHEPSDEIKTWVEKAKIGREMPCELPSSISALGSNLIDSVPNLQGQEEYGPVAEEQLEGKHAEPEDLVETQKIKMPRVCVNDPTNISVELQKLFKATISDYYLALHFVKTVIPIRQIASFQTFEDGRFEITMKAEYQGTLGDNGNLRYSGAKVRLKPVIHGNCNPHKRTIEFLSEDIRIDYPNEETNSLVNASVTKIEQGIGGNFEDKRLNVSITSPGRLRSFLSDEVMTISTVFSPIWEPIKPKTPVAL